MKPGDSAQLALNQYCGIMREIKGRIRSVEAALNGETRLESVLVQEFSYLQLRMVCELIALGCLVAHGDIKETRYIKKEWSAGAILAAMEGLHSDFYPFPVEQERDEATRIVVMKEHKASDWLTKSELIKLNGRCGDFLHRGTYKNIFEVRRRRPVNFDEIANYAQRIFNLLSSHSMFLLDEKKTIFHCGFTPGPEEGVRAYLMAKE